MFAPASARRSAIARPNPCAPPVTTAQRPFRSILFMGEPLIAWLSEHVTAIDDEVDAGGERAFVAPQIDRHGRDLLGGAEPAHLLAGDEFLASIRACGSRALEHRRRLHGAGADAVAADALRDEIE